MRTFALDYDEMDFAEVMKDGMRLQKFLLSIGLSNGFNVAESSPGHYHVKFVMLSDISFNEALMVLEMSNCDPAFKKLVKDRREFTIRISEEMSTHGIKPAPRGIN